MAIPDSCEASCEIPMGEKLSFGQLWLLEGGRGFHNEAASQAVSFLERALGGPTLGAAGTNGKHFAGATPVGFLLTRMSGSSVIAYYLGGGISSLQGLVGRGAVQLQCSTCHSLLTMPSMLEHQLHSKVLTGCGCPTSLTGLLQG